MFKSRALVICLFQEMKDLPSKTPVSVLQELLSRRGTTPKYELVQIEGAIHEPTFRYRVTVADVVGEISVTVGVGLSVTIICKAELDCCLSTALGTGRSKKEAKHAAAKAVLDKLIGGQTDGMSNSTTPSIPDV